MFALTVTFIILASVRPASTKIQVGCPDGWTFYEEYKRCIYSGKGKVSYLDAYTTCDSMNAEIYDFDEDEWEGGVYSLLNDIDTSGVSGIWLWDHDTYEDAVGEDCHFVEANAGGGFPAALPDGRWYTDRPCDDNSQEVLYFCERWAGLKDCFGSSCYHLVDDTKGCYKDPANGTIYPARIDSIEENTWVTEFLKDAPQVAQTQNFRANDFKSDALAYISGGDSEEEGTWILDNGANMTYFHWAESDGEPNNARVTYYGEDCIAMPLDGTGGWKDVSCSLWDNLYLCEEETANSG